MLDDPTARFAALFTTGDDIALDDACLLIARHALADLDEDAERARLDELAAGVPRATASGVVDHLCGHLGFGGDRSTYHDARNSLLPSVLDRRLGIPITLAIVAMEVGRRRDVPLVGIGMPGHFLVRAADDSDHFLDLFVGGTVLDRTGCRAVFERLHPRGTWDDSFLAPATSSAIVARVLANLAGAYRRAGQRADLAWALELRLLLPGAPARDRTELMATLASLGRFDAAAEVADRGPDGPGSPVSTRLRARLN